MDACRGAPWTKKVERAFYSRHALEVAPELLGLLIVHESEEATTIGRITEVEAYVGTEDRACHAFGGRRTRRNEVMYGPPGHAYVYFTYGMHHCLNIVCAREGVPHAVLIRSLEPLAGLPTMAARRGLPESLLQPGKNEGSAKKSRRLLACGPGRLCKAMGISLRQNGADLTDGPLYLAYPAAESPAAREWISLPRVGIDYAGEAKEYPWRFCLKDSDCISCPPASRRRGAVERVGKEPCPF